MFLSFPRAAQGCRFGALRRECVLPGRQARGRYTDPAVFATGARRAKTGLPRGAPGLGSHAARGNQEDRLTL